MYAPMEYHVRYLTNVNAALPEHIARVARAFVEPARALGLHDLEHFERLVDEARMLEGPADVPLAKVLDDLPRGAALTEARRQLNLSRAAADARDFSEAVWFLFHAKNAACVALI